MLHDLPREWPLFDASVPSLLLLLFASVVLYTLLAELLRAAPLERWFWHPALVRFALFVCIFAALGGWWYQ